MNKPKQRANVILRPKYILPLIIIVILAVATITLLPSYLVRHRLAAIKHDMAKIHQEIVSGQDATAEISDGCGKDTRKYGGGPTYCSVGVEGRVSGTADSLAKAQEVIDKTIRRNNFDVLSHRVNDATGLTTNTYIHKGTRFKCSLRYDRDDVRGTDQLFYFSCGKYL